nr:acidic endochitinase-like [Ziziphus jujuba var. spinosa]
MAPLAKLIVACLMLSSALIQISEADGGIATYWGQYADDTEGTLAEACATNLYSYINIAEITQFGGDRVPELNLADHCEPSCTHIGRQITTCQSNGVKVLVSAGGAAGNYTLESAEDAEKVAWQLWNYYLGGSDPDVTRPLGDAVLDGIDFAFNGVSTEHDDDLVRSLKAIFNQQETKTYYLSASPQCVIPDYYLKDVIATGLLDFVWVHFYNNDYCDYTVKDGVDNLLNSWDQWNKNLTGSEKLFLGVPASEDAVYSGGYIEPHTLINEVLPEIKETTRYGGVMVWNRYYDVKSNYSYEILPYVDPNVNPPVPTMSMHQYE